VLKPYVIVSAQWTIGTVRDIQKNVEVRIRVHFDSGRDSVTRRGTFNHHLGHGRLHSRDGTLIAEPEAHVRLVTFAALDGFLAAAGQWLVDGHGLAATTLAIATVLTFVAASGVAPVVSFGGDANPTRTNFDARLR
jgi:hypothetical protein